MDHLPMKEKTDGDVETLAANDLTHTQSVQNGAVASPKGRWQRTWPVLAAGAGLFSDGYLNNVIGSVSTMLATIYPNEYANSSAQQNVSSITFAGTVLGILIFGFCSDHWSRKGALLVSTGILIVTAILCTGAYGYHGSISGLFVALTVYRFFLGIGIGGEYPAGSVAAAEATGELKHGHRHRWFILFTNFQIDLGFVIGAFVPLVCVWICSDRHLRLAWRLALGFGVFPPLSLLWLRTKLQEPVEYHKETMKNTRVPWLLVIKFYWKRLAVVSAVWFMYNVKLQYAVSPRKHADPPEQFSSYAFAIYSSTILSVILGDSAPLWKIFAWNTVINLFYMPGAFLGAFLSDYVGGRRALAYGLAAQAIVGFIMAGCYVPLAQAQHVAAFAVVYGIFLSLGELGPGDNIGIVVSKTCATAIRGRYYGVAGAIGKSGAFVGSYAFPIMERNAPGGASSTRAAQDPFWVASSLCVFSCALVWFCLPNVGQTTIADEDIAFRAYLEDNGWDTRNMGTGAVAGQELNSAEMQQ
ncbi:glycerophosphoinositol permease [Exophiala xenobiotica]|nr:glycerophosphoinositol permease [Exophiala xenobiotica]KAK5374583.1 glycerophosphoinositol permease [Exophiala xenobiotica]KAK5396733.1 glycerophosphoinositol permease [Exophiala xenobiotica]KAK5410856.1 glycerophosphoinositol permease [Exophiala xenobiotica]KAK5470612.1 glycerophosphoinositol permease [Exophiala xenobiotica]